ncbi:aspartic proteinase-like protein 1-like isoform X2 [Tripterygium wilfordii]|uniref:Aspartic proteinase-like protein 1-like isoform X2 n=1 Tax=Tripterygium wilfordii TaxID=458696 RepID=A0A7J7CW25_TRIWF|nr:aspartyl protease family protein 1-like [Tripterygium wilfordii]KAF5738106.1 aspartic proteinase-like protein 1-like isoform X2 [Tripterygium wilfordii]
MNEEGERMVYFFRLVLIALSIFVAFDFKGYHCSGGRIFSLKMHHRFSDSIKNWSLSTGKFFDWPVKKGSFEYYAILAHRDRLMRLRGRKLSDLESPLAFSDGNSTFRISSLGFLHYATVELGTPGMKFMVALDTGSDLFWVPCDCSRCAPTQGTAYASEFELSVYSPKESSTSKKVTCNNLLCEHRNRCPGTFSDCPYMVSYVSAQTSTSGILVEDVLHLATGDTNEELVEAYVTFGCGQVQSGSFLDIAAPNGLFGLGMEKISVPSILSREGLTADSFSMCFGHDGIGRINFGDKGSSDQEETPFNANPPHPTYNITMIQIRVGTTLIDVDLTALFDSGTSFTYLVDPTYTSLAENFHSQTRDRRRPLDSRIPFEYCYYMSPDANSSLIPSLSLTMKGGSHFAVYDPIIVISTPTELVYCLAVVKSAELNIVGQNFMTGYRVVFDREKLVLGWKKFDCYDIDEYNTIPIERHNSTVPPAVAAGLGNYPTPNSTKESRNFSESSAALPSYHSHTSFLPVFSFAFTLYLLL